MTCLSNPALYDVSPVTMVQSISSSLLIGNDSVHKSVLILCLLSLVYGICAKSSMGVFAGLGTVEGGVMSIFCYQFLVGTVFYDPAAVHHQDQVRIPYGGKTVCDHKGGASF